MKFSLYQPLAIHELGQRANQEDNIYPQLGRATASDRLFLVCDGMGGHERGEVASSIVCQAIPQYFQQAGISPDKGLSDDDLRNAIEYAFLQLDRADNGAMKKMGTTLTLLYMHRCGVTCAHIGDSRIYHIRPISSPKIGEAGRGLNGGGLLFQSRDHSLVYDLYQAGEIAYEEMRTSPQKNIITRAMQPGEDNRVRADIVHITNVQPGDYFYLCTDGMLEEMENDELVSLISSSKSDEEIRKQLIAVTQNNHDNHSAYLIHVKTVTNESGDAANPDDESTSRFNALNIRPALEPTDDDDVSIVELPQPSRQATPPPIPQRVKSPTLKMPAKWKKLLIALVALLLLAIVGYGIFKPEKKDVKKDSVMPVLMYQQPQPIQSPVVTIDVQVKQPSAANDSGKVSKDSSMTNKDKNGQQQ